MKKRLTQTQVLAKALAKRPLTGKQIEALGIQNYKGRIFDLRKILLNAPEWVVLHTEMVEKKTRWGRSRIAVYYLTGLHKRIFVKQFCGEKS